MSSFTTVKTEMYEEHTLREVIKALGFQISEEKELKNYYGTIQNVDFQVIGRGGKNIGFKKVGRCYEIIADTFMNKAYKSTTRMILQNYAQKIVMRNVNALGYTQVKRTVGKDNTIKLVLVKR